MPLCDPRPVVCSIRASALWYLFFAGLVVGLFSCPPAYAQAPGPPPLRLEGVTPGGLRVSATERWGTFEFELANLSDVDRLARLVVLYEGRPDVQYSRDLWTPAHSTVSSWMLVGPAVSQQRSNASDLQVLLYDLTDGDERLLLPPGEERIRSRPVFFQKHEPYTLVLADDPPGRPPFGQLPRPESVSDSIVHLARAFRQTSSLSELVHIARPGDLPPTPEAFEGIDHFIIASNRIARDIVGLRALRQWLERGGRVIVMLDQVEPETLATLLGAAPDFQIVDRVHLTDCQIETRPAEGRAPPPLVQRYDPPVDFVRVLLPSHERAMHTINGWPAWFVRRVGRGKVVFATLGVRAWYRPRTRTDPPSPFASYPSLPIATEPLNAVATAMLPTDDDLFPLESLRPLVVADIGYAVLGRGTVALVFALFLLVALALGIAMRRSPRRTLLGWIGPMTALGAAAVFVVLGASSRQATPPTVAVAQIVDAVPDADEAPVRGILALYRPDSGPVAIGAGQGGMLEPDMSGMDGQTRRLRLTDLDAWRWDNLSFPAGVHFASFRYSVPTDGPISSVARFGPEGVEGRLKAGALRGISDAILTTPGGRNLSVRLDPDGTFKAGGEDALLPGHFLAGAVLSDRQQRRQEIYREFLKRPLISRSEGRTMLLAWAEPIELPFALSPTVRTAGSALLVVPLQLKRASPGSHVAVPGPLISCQRILEAGATKLILQASTSADIHLRFQLPAEALPLKVERARLTAKVNAPSRRVTVAGRTDTGQVELFQADSPLDPIRVDVADERLLHLDAEGGLHLNLSLSDLLRTGAEEAREVRGDETWTIEYLELEINGTTAPDEK
jgi:hypothetical protein